MSYVYIPRTKDAPATVGFYDPTGKWIPESDHKTDAEAAERVHWLNGGCEKFDVSNISPFEAAVLKEMIQ